MQTKKIDSAALEKELKTLEHELSESEQIVQDMQDRQVAVRKRIAVIKSTLKPKNLVITDHAILRYLEREHGISIDEVKNEMLRHMEPGNELWMIRLKGFVVKENRIVTYIPPKQIPVTSSP